MMLRSRRSAGFTLVELLIALVTLTLMLSLMAPSLGPFINYDQRKTTGRKLEQIRAAMLLGYRDNAFVMEGSAAQQLTFNGVTIENGAVAAAGAGGTFSGLARYSQLSPDQMVVDGYNRRVQVFVTNRLSRPVHGQNVFFHMAAVVSGGENGALHASTTFDANTGILTLAGDDMGVVVDGFEVQRELFDLTFKRMSRVADAYQSYFQARYLSDPARDISIDYFAATQPDGTTSSRWDGGGTFRTSAGAGAGLGTLNADVALGMSAAEYVDGWGNTIMVDNSSALVRHPNNATVSMQTPPYSARIGTTLPGALSFVISINSQF